MKELGHTNHLSNETSPYLLQHAHNPVDWRPWGQEALARAHEENRPILLSIGYSACHWCHVMERECFEDVYIASLMNENFVSIKVDREERPDLDQIYQNAAQLLGVQGGWPLTMFLTPDQKPFHAGTYFPPKERHGLPSFPRVLQSVAKAYRMNAGAVDETARQVQEGLEYFSALKAEEGPLDSEFLDRAARALLRHMDPVHGGFGGAPKFPNAMNLAFLLRRHRARGDEFAMRMVTLALEKMAVGGIYDQLGGGFHRYSVDERWLAPHFEKMLYDNALLVRLYLEAWQAAKRPLFERVARETIGYVRREMQDPGGGFYSAQDADSEGEEGRFFVWTQDEVMETLGEEAGRIFCRAYDVTGPGNFENRRNILNSPVSADVVAAREGIPTADVERILAEARRKLFNVRERRVKPFRDEKILTSWNGLMISACAEAFNVLGDAAALESAVRGAEFILARLLKDGRLLRTFKDGQAKLNGYLDDYAFFVAALLDLYQATFERRYLEQALALHERMIALFWDEERGGFFFTSSDHEPLINRPKSAHDHSIPSGTSAATNTMLRLHALTGGAVDLTRAERVFHLYRSMLEENPLGFGSLLCAIDWHVETPYTVAIIGAGDAGGAKALIMAAHQEFAPNKIIVATESQDLDQFPAVADLAAGKGAVYGKATAYVCNNFTCSTPVTDYGSLQAMLKGN